MAVTSILLFSFTFTGGKAYAAPNSPDVHYHTPKFFSVPNGVMNASRIRTVVVKDLGVNSWVLRVHYEDNRIEDIRCKDKAEAMFYLSKIRQQLVE